MTAVMPPREASAPISLFAGLAKVSCQIHRREGSVVLVEIRSMAPRQNLPWVDVGHVAWADIRDLEIEGERIYLICGYYGTDGSRVVVQLPSGQYVSTPISEVLRT